MEQICTAIYHTALDAGFRATIGVQEVTSHAMPSFPGEVVHTALLVVDLQYDPELVIVPGGTSGNNRPAEPN